LELPSKLPGVHNVFHISQLKRCLKPPTDVVIEDTIPLEPDLMYKAYPMKILEQQDWTTQKKTTRFYKVQWNDHLEDEPMWEREDFLQSNFLELLPLRKNLTLAPLYFPPFINLRTRFILRGRPGTPHVMVLLTIS
jgi:hypothetical protein